MNHFYSSDPLLPYNTPNQTKIKSLKLNRQVRGARYCPTVAADPETFTTSLLHHPFQVPSPLANTSAGLGWLPGQTA